MCCHFLAQFAGDALAIEKSVTVDMGGEKFDFKQLKIKSRNFLDIGNLWSGEDDWVEKRLPDLTIKQ